jgi:hypothetical protein
VWDLDIGEQSEVFVNVLRIYPPGVPYSREAGGEPPLVSMGLGVPKGTAVVSILDHEPVKMQAPPGVAIMSWNSKKGLLEPQKIAKAPDQWTRPLNTDKPGTKETSEDMRKTLEEFAARLESKNSDVETALQELLQQEQKPAALIIGVHGLGAVSRIKSLLDALDESFRPLTPQIILVLQHWCGRRVENDRELNDQLRKKNFTEEQADQVLELLHNFSEEEIRKAGTYQILFRHLGNEKLAIRALAFFHLAQFDPAGIPVAKYSPELEDPERGKAIDRWRRRLTEGKLPPKPPVK